VSDASSSVHAKLAAVRRSKIEVTKVREPDSAFAWAEADAVFGKVQTKLDHHKLVVKSGVLGEPKFVMGKEKVLACVLLQVTLTDVAAPLDGDREIVGEWAGETWLDPDTGERGIAAAITSALKGWYVHTFAVKLLPAPLASGTVYTVAGAQKVSTAQIEKFIGQAQKEAGLTGAQVIALANDLCDQPISGLAELPRAAADDLVDLIKSVGARERARERDAAAAGNPS